MPQPILIHWALLGYLVLVWGFAFAAIAIALESFHPFFIVWCRLWMGAIVMWVVWRWRVRSFPMERGWWLHVTLLSLTGNIIPFSLIAWAEQSVPSAEVGILMALMPIATLVLAHWLLEHEPLTKRRFLGVVTGFLGVALLVGDDLFSGAGRGQWSGQLATLLATLSYAFNGVYAKRVSTGDPVTLALGTLIVGSAIMTIPAISMQGTAQGFVFEASSLGALVLLGVMATGIATWCYFVVVSARGPGFLSTINYLIPGVAFAAGTLWLGEPWGWEHLIALLLILVGVGLIQVRGRGY